MDFPSFDLFVLGFVFLVALREATLRLRRILSLGSAFEA